MKQGNRKNLEEQKRFSRKNLKVPKGMAILNFFLQCGMNFMLYQRDQASKNLPFHILFIIEHSNRQCDDYFIHKQRSSFQPNVP